MLILSNESRNDKNTRESTAEVASHHESAASIETAGTEAQTESLEESSDLSSVEAEAQAMIEAMSLEEKIGQMLFVRAAGENTEEMIQNYHIGGIVLFGVDFEGKDSAEVIEMIQNFQSASDIPLLIATDEEGGTVVRASSNPQLADSPFESPQQVYAEGGMDAVIADTQKKAAFLSGLGINVNLAPVADVSVDASDFIYARSFGQDAARTAEYVGTVVRTAGENGMASVLKHFPGYGNNADTHTGIAYDTRDFESFTQSDFLPFISGIENGAGGILVSHNIMECVDAGYPASLSPEVHDILRNRLSYTGVIMTDDLDMGAITE